VQDHAAGVDYVAQPWRNPGSKARTDDQRPLNLIDRPVDSLGRHLQAKSLDNARVPELLEEIGVRRLVDQRAYGGQG